MRFQSILLLSILSTAVGQRRRQRNVARRRRAQDGTPQPTLEGSASLFDHGGTGGKGYSWLTPTPQTPQPTPSPTKAPVKAPTKSPVAIGTTSPTVSSHPTYECFDSPTFTFELDIGGSVDCAWLTQNKLYKKTQERLRNYCGRDGVKYQCAASCSTCRAAVQCADDPDFEFKLLLEGSMKGCSWLTQSVNAERTEYRLTTYCGGPDMDVSGSCPESCGLCPASPTASPTTGAPTKGPTKSPTKGPTPPPSDLPSMLPSTSPSDTPSDIPSSSPSDAPSDIPSASPSDTPSLSPSDMPSALPSSSPSDLPSTSPSDTPSDIPSSSPSDTPSDIPSSSPSALPSLFSNAPSSSPSLSAAPTKSPTKSPTATPTAAPTVSAAPTTSCKDNSDFTFTLRNVGDDVSCAWITQNPSKTETRKKNYCDNPEIKYNCIHSCDACDQCEDDLDFSFELINDPGEMRDCLWICWNSQFLDERRERYCGDEDIGEACPVACGFCTAPLSH